MKLYQITQAYREIQDVIRNAESEEEFAEAADLLGAIEDKREEKIDNCCKILFELEAEATAYDNEITRLKMKCNAIENRAERLKKYIAFCLGEGNQLKTELFNLTWRKSQAVQIDDEGAIPEAYQRVRTIKEPDKKMIGDALKIPGTEIPGCQLITKQNLQIK